MRAGGTPPGRDSQELHAHGPRVRSLLVPSALYPPFREGRTRVDANGTRALYLAGLGTRQTIPYQTAAPTKRSVDHAAAYSRDP